MFDLVKNTVRKINLPATAPATAPAATTPAATAPAATAPAATAPAATAPAATAKEKPKRKHSNLFQPEQSTAGNKSQVQADVTNSSKILFPDFVKEQLKNKDLQSEIEKIEEHSNKKGFDIHLKDKSTLTVKEKMMQTNDFKSDAALNLMLSLIEKAKKLNMTFKISARYSQDSEKEDLQALLEALNKLRDVIGKRQIQNVDIVSIDNAEEALENEIVERTSRPRKKPKI